MKFLEKIKKKSKYISILIVLHHYMKHRGNTRFSLLDKFVQFNDINNHETWALFFLGIYLGSKKNLIN